MIVCGCQDGAHTPGAVIDLSGRDIGILAPAHDAGLSSALLDAEALNYLDASYAPRQGRPGPGPTGDCVDGEVLACDDECGLHVCTDGLWADCAAGAERCNDHDDNCDGRVDEIFMGLGISCTVDSNGCSAVGTRVCNAAQTEVICEADEVDSTPETCDGVDNDCDGDVDEDFPGTRCCTENYHCPPGSACLGGECEGDVGGAGGGGNGGECQTFLDCEFGEFCFQGTCAALCFGDADCAGGEVCGDAGFCVEQVPCGEDRDCVGALICDDGDCVVPPGADSCEAAQPILGAGRYLGSTVGRFDTLSPSCGGAASGSEMVFLLTPEVGGQVRVSTLGSGFDTVLSVRSECGEANAELVCNDDSGGLTSEVEFRARAGVEYAIIVDGYGADDVGEVVLRVTMNGAANGAPPEPDPDADPDPEPAPQLRMCEECDDGQCVAGLCAPPIPDLCEGATVGDRMGVYQGNTDPRPNRLSPDCVLDSNAPEEVVLVMVAEDMELRATTAGTGYDTVLYVLENCDPGVAVSCNDDSPGGRLTSSLTWRARAGVPYYVVVDGYGNNSGAFRLNITPR